MIVLASIGAPSCEAPTTHHEQQNAVSCSLNEYQERNFSMVSNQNLLSIAIVLILLLCTYPQKPSSVTPTMASTLYDALIIGAGPAGLSAALGLSRVHRTKVVFTRPLNAGFRNEGAQEMHNVLSRDCTPPIEFRQIARDQIKKYGTTEFIEADITSVERVEQLGEDKTIVPSHFKVVDTQGRKWQGRKLVLAMGSAEVLPVNIPGFKENWPHNM